ncbi:hypothetical protein FJY63_06140 [Candidatus Sumerlaeota bacterium]|nr:hypothetical protein [Candidatus Sumerlaeota bacterium]
MAQARAFIISAAIALTAGCQLPVGQEDQRAGATGQGKSPTQVVENPANPLAAYIKPPIADEFNPDVSDEERRSPRPRRGGRLIVRTPSDIGTLNPLLINLEPEHIVLSYLTDYPESLVHRDTETLEYMPRMAAYYKVRDYIEKRDGMRIEGLVTTESRNAVSIIPNASIWTFLRSEIVSSDSKSGYLSKHFARPVQGAEIPYPAPRPMAIMIAETSGALPTIHPKSELKTWPKASGKDGTTQTCVRRRCIYEFRLREGIQWHDGAAVTMENLKCWFDTMRNPRVDCAAIRNYYIDIEKLELADKMTAKFTYSRPYALALDYCGGAGFLPTHILRPERFRDDPDGYGEYFNKHPMGQPGTGRFVGWGAYRLEHWTAGQEIAVVRNDNYWACKANLPYWDANRPYLDRIVWRVIRETTPALRELENGNIDADFDVEPDTWLLPQTKSAAFTSRFVRAVHSVPSYTYIGWNMERDPFKEPLVRRALTMLIPRAEILRKVHHGLGYMLEGPFIGPCADLTVKPIPYDPSEARRLLRRARWIDRDSDGILDKDGKKFEFEYLVHTAREYHVRIADVVYQSLARAGIKVNIRKVDFPVMHLAVTDHNFDAVRFAWGENLDTDPYQVWHSSQSKERGSNYVSYHNKEVDSLIEQAREEFDPMARWKILRNVFRLIYEDQPYTFLFNLEQPVFYPRRFRGVRFYQFQPGYDYTEWYESTQSRF